MIKLTYRDLNQMNHLAYYFVIVLKAKTFSDSHMVEINSIIINI